jgi:CRP-like cAMP-binding protein
LKGDMNKQAGVISNETSCVSLLDRGVLHGRPSPVRSARASARLASAPAILREAQRIEANRLLAALPPRERERLASHLEPYPVVRGAVIAEPRSRWQHIYFPTSSILSMQHLMADGASSEIASVGNEGMLGVSLFMGGNAMPSRAVVQTSGDGYRLRAEVLIDEFNRGGIVQQLLLRYAQALLTQIAQTAACNRHHSVAQQLCRWLLMNLDRESSNELSMTQELIAHTLGVRREGVTQAAGMLQQAGIIRYRRGHITVLERTGLEAQVCECYDVVKHELARLVCAADDAGDRCAPVALRSVGAINDRAHVHE